MVKFRRRLLLIALFISPAFGCDLSDKVIKIDKKNDDGIKNQINHDLIELNRWIISLNDLKIIPCEVKLDSFNYEFEAEKLNLLDRIAIKMKLLLNSH